MQSGGTDGYLGRGNSQRAPTGDAEANTSRMSTGTEYRDGDHATLLEGGSHASNGKLSKREYISDTGCVKTATKTNTNAFEVSVAISCVCLPRLCLSLELVAGSVVCLSLVSVSVARVRKSP